MNFTRKYDVFYTVNQEGQKAKGESFAVYTKYGDSDAKCKAEEILKEELENEGYDVEIEIGIVIARDNSGSIIKEYEDIRCFVDEYWYSSDEFDARDFAYSLDQDWVDDSNNEDETVGLLMDECHLLEKDAKEVCGWLQTIKKEQEEDEE